MAKLEVDFFRAGGTLLVGTDPTGGGGVIAGYSNQRALELLVEAGLTPLEAIKVGTLNGATFLGRGALVGSIAAGKQADLVVIDGDPSARIERRAQRDARVQARRRLRSGEADRVGEGAGWAVLTRISNLESRYLESRISKRRLRVALRDSSLEIRYSRFTSHSRPSRRSCSTCRSPSWALQRRRDRT